MLGQRRRLDLRQHRLVGFTESALSSLNIEALKECMLTPGVQSGLFGICERFWLLVEIVDVRFEVDVGPIASGCRVQLADFVLVHHLYVRHVLQG